MTDEESKDDSKAPLVVLPDGTEVTLETLINDFVYFQAHQMVASQRIYDLLLFIANEMADDNGVSASKIMDRHAKHEYKWPGGTQ